MMARIQQFTSFTLREYVTEMKGEIRRNLQRAAEDLSRGLARDIEAAAPKRKRWLAASIRPSVRSTRGGVFGAVTASTEYAHFLEAGFNDTQQVAAHYRRIKKAFGRPITPRNVMIAAHPRAVNFSGRRFMRGPLQAWEARIRDAFQRAIEAGMRK